MTRLPTFVLALVVPVIAVIAVIGTRVVEGSEQLSAVQAGANEVIIKNFSFEPRKLSVAAGTKLEVANADGATHTFTARDGSFDTGKLSSGKRATIALAKSGTYDYFCEIHDFMTGTLVVR